MEISVEQFPSPCGVCGLKSRRRYGNHAQGRQVSVPLRGLWFEIKPVELTSLVEELKVSVPLRGLWFEIGIQGSICRSRNPFPSPCGVCGLKSSFSICIFLSLYVLFPSPCGVCGLKSLRQSLICALLLDGFRPLAGFVV